MNTAVTDGLVLKNPCQVKGAGVERSQSGLSPLFLRCRRWLTQSHRDSGRQRGTRLAGRTGSRASIFHDLRHSGNSWTAATGASTAELMARIGHASAAASLRYQHATADRDLTAAFTGSLFTCITTNQERRQTTLPRGLSRERSFDRYPDKVGSRRYDSFMRLTPVLTKAMVVHDYVVEVVYADGLVAEVDLSYLKALGPVFEPLSDPDYFRRLRASRDANTILWPNGTDIAPESLYAAALEAVGSAARQRAEG
jgi:Protein of unknown function (DUF2442)